MKDTTEQANITPNVIKSTPDSVSKDSTNVDVRTIKIAENDLEDNVQYKAEDSIIYDITNKTVLLYGRATIKYQKMDMAAGKAAVQVASLGRAAQRTDPGHTACQVNAEDGVACLRPAADLEHRRQDRMARKSVHWSQAARGDAH